MRAELTPDEQAYVAAARVARLATVDPDGRPHVAAICPALDGGRLLFATDHGSAKVANMRAHPHVALGFDDYVEDWSRLRQVLARGTALIHDDGPVWERGRSLLYEKFPQYESEAPIVAGRSVLVEVGIEQASSSGL